MTSGGIIAKEIRKLDSKVPILGTYPMESKKDIELSEGALENTEVYSMASSVKSGEQLIKKYTEKYNKDPIIPYGVLESYDRVYIIKDAIEKCNKLDTTCIKNKIYNTTYNLSLGTYAFDNKGDIDTFYTAVFKIENNTSNILIDEITIKK